MLNPAVMKRAVILAVWICSLFLWAVPSQGSPIGDMPGPETDSDIEWGSKRPGINAEDRFRMVDQLGSVGIDDSSFFDFSGEGETGPGTRAAPYDVEVYTGGIGGGRTSVSDIDRGRGFDRGVRFDEGTRVDRGAAFDRGAKVDTGAGFDSVGRFDRERTLRVGEEREQPSSLFRRKERSPIKREKEETFLAREEGGGRVESGLTKEESEREALSTEKEKFEQDLLRSEELEIRSFKPTQTAFFLKIAMFAVALLLLLAGTLKGVIPFRFYFFMTILILILWNPMESLFISIIVGLSALLAPILG